MMKLYKSIFAVMTAIASLGFASCDNDFDRPPVILPEATYEANMTIAEFKQQFWDVAQSNSSAVIPLSADGDSIILGGRIISSDEDGNIYQHVYLRDETAAIDIRIYGSGIYESYPMGQDVRINVTGLLVGGYGTQMQIGTEYNGGVGGMDEDVFFVRAQRNGLPTAETVTPKVVTLGELQSKIGNKEALIEWQCQLIKMENVSFVGGGSLKWSDTPGQTGTTTRQLKDSEGKTIDVRTSNKSTFASEVLPKGNGSIIAILGYFNGKWQLSFMNPESGCIDGFEFVDAPETPVTPDTPTTGETFFTALGEDAASIDWAYESNSADGVETVWSWKEYSGKHYLNASAFVGSVAHAAKAYAISPVIDMSARKSAKLSFDHAAKFQTTLRSLCCPVVREEGASAWTELTVPTWPEAGSWTFVSSGDIDLSAFAGKKVQIGFKYGSDATGADTWEIKNVKISE